MGAEYAQTTLIDSTAPAPLAPHTIARPRLMKALNEAPGRRVTVLTASAGFGKTTALAMWAAVQRCAWYTASSADADPVTLARGLIASLAPHTDSLTTTLGPAVEGTRGPDADEHAIAEALASAISAALRIVLTSDVTVVIDDLQEIPETSAGMRLIAGLCHMAPRRLHLILASRVDLPFPVTRLRLSGQLLHLTAESLAFDRDEAAELLCSLGEPARREDAETVIAITGGWPAAVRLVAEQLVAASAPKRLLRELQSGSGAAQLLDVLLDAEVAAAPPSIRSVLGVGAALSAFNAELLTHLGVPDAASVLEAMRRHGIHVIPAAREGWVTLTPLSREYARDRLVSADECRRIRNAAVAWHLERGDAAIALSYACRSDPDTVDPQTVASILETFGSQLLASGECALVTEALTTLDPSDRSPGIDLVEGEAAQVRGDWDRAVVCLSRLVPDEGTVSAAVAWRLGLIHHMRGDLQAAMALYRRGRDDPDGAPGDRALAAAWAAAAAWLMGDADDCRSLVADAERLAGPTDSRALAAAHTARAMLAALDGDRRGNDMHYSRALEHAERANDLLQLIRIRANRGSRLLEEGFYEEALSETDTAIELAELAGFATMHALALSNRAVANRMIGRFDEAVRDLRAALTIQQRIGSRMAGYALTILGDVYSDQGSVTMARAAYEEAIALAEPARDVQRLVPALAGLARVVATEEPALADRLLGRAMASPANLGHATALLAAGWVALGRGDRQAVRDYGTRARAHARSRRDRAGVAEALELLAAATDTDNERYERLSEAESMWQTLGCPLPLARTQLAILRCDQDRAALPAEEIAARATRIEQTCRRLGARAMAAEAATLRSSVEAPARAPAVTIRTLGGFQVLHAGVAVPHQAWQSRKARDLLKILIAHRGAPVPRTLLCEYLWPETDPDRAGNRLSVAISTLRQVLDRSHAFPSDHYVASGEGAVRLRLEHVDVDVESFLRCADTALTSGTLADLIAAEAMYGGDFCTEDRYADWADALREEARSAYVAVERALARHYADRADHETAIRHLHRLLTCEPYDEQAHLLIVRELDVSGRHGDARRMYRAYVQRMTELDLEPAPYPEAAA
ncbi:MAG TPA: BTAD domain-containing putative transcriptional regulator [Micromonosporaceae bacterium]|nr:BTAD domain-containing putative transcriptional regulator [Micromonosporaceae bacterium]